MDEQQLVELYMDLTGTAEPAARNVFMMVCESDGCADANQGNGREPLPNDQRAKRNPEPRFTPPAVSLLLALAVCYVPWILKAADLPANQPQRQQPFGAPLSLAEALNLALRQSPSILRAQKELEASQGIVVQTRAIALPTLAVTGNFAAVERSDIDILDVAFS